MIENARVTRNHNKIRKWVEEHGGIPAYTAEKITPDEQEKVLRIIFKNEKNSEKIIVMNWNDFFTKFDQANLAFLYSDDLENGNKTNYYKFVSLDGE